MKSNVFHTANHSTKNMNSTHRKARANIHFTEYKQKYFAKSNKIDNFAHGKPNVQKQSRGRESRCPYLRQDKN